MDGKNVMDFIDADIVEKLEALEREEEKLEAEGFYDSEEDMVHLLSFLLLGPLLIHLPLVRLGGRARGRRARRCQVLAYRLAANQEKTQERCTAPAHRGLAHALRADDLADEGGARSEPHPGARGGA